MAGKNWQIEGRYVEHCSCDHGCPCETMADPTYGDWNQNGLLHTYDEHEAKYGRP